MSFSDILRRPLPSQSLYTESEDESVFDDPNAIKKQLDKEVSEDVDYYGSSYGDDFDSYSSDDSNNLSYDDECGDSDYSNNYEYDEGGDCSNCEEDADLDEDDIDDIADELEDIDLDDELNMIDLNITALHILTKLFLRDFKKKDKGIILNVASVAGFMPGPLLSSYYASKNYVLKLSIAIYEELRREKSNVSITVLCPGPVDTNFNNRAGVSFSVKPITPDYAADCALKKAFAGKLFALPGLSIKLAAAASGFVPNKMLAAIVYNIQQSKKTSDGKGKALK